MAKGNMLQGQARGSVGDVTFAVLKGQQISKMRNRKPANPKTESQMIQRAFFANAVKFFTRGNQNMFKFAFEDKKNTESDFNAFMRRNVKNGVMISPTANKLASYPALGNFIMSSGSFNYDPTLAWSADDEMWSTVNGFKVDNSVTEVTTVAQLSNILLASGFKSGDIITILSIAAKGSTTENTPWAYPTKRKDIEWHILQIVVDSANTDALPIGMQCDIISKTGYKLVKISVSPFGLSTEICAATLVCSRQTTSGLVVSNSVLVGNTVATGAIEEALTSEEYLVDVLNDWGAADKSILEGGL